MVQVLNQPGEPLVCPLTLKGEATGGEVVLAAELSTRPSGHHMLRIQVRTVSRAHPRGWVNGGHTIFLQVYPVPPDTDTSDGPLPEPTASVLLPQGVTEVPFTLKLPDTNLPSSNHVSFLDGCFVTYSIFSNVDIKW